MSQMPYSPRSSLETTMRASTTSGPDPLIDPKIKSEPRSPKSRPVCGFLPLPSVTTFPICIPTSITPSHIQPELFVSSVASTPVPNIASCSSLRVLFPPSTPTWIATPPTPPSKPIRRSNSSASRRQSHCIPISPSASFPASMHPHANDNINDGLRRSSSVPAPSTRSRINPHTFQGRMGAYTVQSPEESTSIDNPVDATFSVNGNVSGPATMQKKTEPYSGLHAKPVFHLSNIVTDAESEDGTFFDRKYASSPDEPSSEVSGSDYSTEDLWETERHKDALRRFHALKELLATEVGYLVDLKALVTVYLRILPTLAARSLTTSSTFGRASASFTTGPWIHSYTQLQAAAISSSATLPETQNLVSSTSSVKELKTNSRYLFSDTELECLTRNAEEILKLHDYFVKELRDVLEPLEFYMEHDKEHGYKHLGNLDSVILAVSTKFATEASRFNAYQSFCAGHPEAMDIIRKVSQRFPLEIDAFEQRCATLVYDISELGKPEASESKRSSSPSNRMLGVDDRKRAMSLTSLDGAARALRPRPSVVVLTKDSVVFPSETRKEKAPPRIAFTDYMIKPIQRICKYPLLLDQLLPSKALRTLSQNSPEARSDVEVVVQSAAQAMRHVAASVDEARHKQDVAIQSALILSRICHGISSAPNLPSFQVLTTEFFSSLGNCLLSGSLDVMHYHRNRPLGETSNIKAKYLGAFLYPGGYLVLVKVSKGKKYEPRHWLSLADFEVSDIEENGAMLPWSFRLSSGEKHFELAAACRREKDAWFSSIQESLTQPCIWINEPTPSFKFDGKGELLPESEDGHSEPPSGLSTIRSIPELAHPSDADTSEPFFASLRGGTRSRKKILRCESSLSFKYDIPPPPSRRSSSTSVKAMFSPMSSDNETVVIRRSSPIARLQVDQELQDVISQSCLNARSYAFSHEEELFQAPKSTRSGFARSNSGIGMARLSKHESVRVSRRRTTDSIDGVVSGTSPLHTSKSSRKNEKLTITSISPNDEDSQPTVLIDSSPSPYPSPPPSSQSSSCRLAPLRPSATAPSTLPTPASLGSGGQSPLKPRSFVHNVKGLFQFRPPVSPVSVIISHPSQTSVQRTVPLLEPSSTPYNMLHRGTKDSLRRRARSIPDHSGDDFRLDDSEKPFGIAPTRVSAPVSA